MYPAWGGASTPKDHVANRNLDHSQCVHLGYVTVAAQPGHSRKSDVLEPQMPSPRAWRWAGVAKATTHAADPARRANRGADMALKTARPLLVRFSSSPGICRYPAGLRRPTSGHGPYSAVTRVFRLKLLRVPSLPMTDAGDADGMQEFQLVWNLPPGPAPMVNQFLLQASPTPMAAPVRSSSVWLRAAQ